MKINCQGVFPYICNYHTISEDGDFSVIKLGTPYPWGFAIEELMYLYWKVNWQEGVTVNMQASATATPGGNPPPNTVSVSNPVLRGSKITQEQLVCGFTTSFESIVGQNSWDLGDILPFNCPPKPYWEYGPTLIQGNPIGTTNISCNFLIDFSSGFYDATSKKYYPKLNLLINSSSSVGQEVYAYYTIYNGSYPEGESGEYRDTIDGPSQSTTYLTDKSPDGVTVSIQKIKFLGIDQNVQMINQQSSGSCDFIGSSQASLSFTEISFDKKNEWQWN